MNFIVAGNTFSLWTINQRSIKYPFRLRAYKGNAPTDHIHMVFLRSLLQIILYPALSKGLGYLHFGIIILPQKTKYFGQAHQPGPLPDRKSTRLNSSHVAISYA